MLPNAHQDNLRAVVSHLALLDPMAGARLKRVLHRIGWTRASEDEAADIVDRCRRLFGGRGIEFAEVIIRVRCGAAPDAVARETSRRWANHFVWERDSRTSYLGNARSYHHTNAA